MDFPSVRPLRFLTRETAESAERVPWYGSGSYQACEGFFFLRQMPDKQGKSWRVWSGSACNVYYPDVCDAFIASALYQARFARRQDVVAALETFVASLDIPCTP